MSFRCFDFICPGCGYEEERAVHRDESLDSFQCPNCEKTLERIWKKAPFGRVGGSGSDRQVASMQQSFKERFVKKEIDDVRHKHGRLFDDSLRSAAAQRIAKETKE